VTPKRSWISLLTSTRTSLSSISDLKIRIVWVILGILSRSRDFFLNSLSSLTMISIPSIKHQQELVKLIHRNLTPNNPVMPAMNKVQPPAKTPKDFYAKFLRVRAENRATRHVANDLSLIKPSTHSSFSTRIMIFLILLLNRRERREVMSLERRIILLSLLMPRPVELVALKVTLDLSVTRVHILIEIRRMCPSCRALWARDEFLSSQQDLTAIQLEV
jgi:hypothetical protein